MVPYIHVPDLHIGPVPLHPFGLLVATGVLVGTSVTTRRARSLGYDLDQLNSFVTWMLVSAFILSHVLDELFYHWDEFVEAPWTILMIWQGLSSFGGFFGAVVGILLWKYYTTDDRGWPLRRARPMPLLPFADLVLSVFPIGWMFGRAGCSTVHDHPGARASANSIFAVAYPNGPNDGPVTHVWFIDFIHGHDPRYDLGFLELLFTIVIVVLCVISWARKLPMGSYVVGLSIAYAPVRFCMDFVRIPETERGGDTRYAGLTPAQYGCILLFLYGLAMIPYVRKLAKSGVDLAAPFRAAPSPAGDDGQGSRVTP